MMRFLQILSLLAVASAETIAEINGNKFLSPLQGRNVTNVRGLVTARGPDGFWIRSTTPDSDLRTSESVYVFGRIISGANVTAGDIVTLNGRVTEYRNNNAYLFLTEITSPSNVTIVSSGNRVRPVILGRENTSPPTSQYTSLDNGDVFSLPNNSSRISQVNPVLEPTKFGLDFWESLTGELVTVRRPTAIAKPNRFGDTWVRGNWPATSRNKRGGLTLTPGDGNPETIIVGRPLDGTRNPNNTKLGDDLEEITGIITQSFGFYYVLPLTALKVNTTVTPALPNPVTWTSNGNCKKITMGDYNIENFSPNSANVAQLSEHITKYLNSPDILFVQEVQDNNGAVGGARDPVVNANQTLDTLVRGISAAGGPTYSYVNIDPVDDSTGGEPGGNIRVAYLYNSKFLALKNANPGSAIVGTEVRPGPSLSFNPGLIEPNNPAWTASRRPLVAQWRVLSSNSTFFTVNVHWGSKGGSTSIQGDPRPPVNGAVDKRLQQANVTATFISQLLAANSQANVIAAGDFNEFAFVQPLVDFKTISGLVDIDDAAAVKPEERYTYLFDMNCQALDHVFLSPRIAGLQPKVEHVHVNTWVEAGAEASDHDPSVVRLDVC